MRIILTSVLVALMTIAAFGNTKSDSVKVYFRVGQHVFDPTLRNNRAVMDSFVNIVRKANIEDRVEDLTVRCYASPEGSTESNERLSGLRCDAIAEYLSAHSGVVRDKIKTYPGGVAWEELRHMVEDNPDVPSREKVLEILDDTPRKTTGTYDKKSENRKERLMALAGGTPYRWMLNNLFPELRNSVAIAVLLDHKEPAVATDTIAEKQTEATPVQTDIMVSDVEDITETDTYQNPLSTLIADNGKNRYFAVKTNMLYDAALVPNIGVEFYAGKNISVYGEWMYAWWDNDNRHRYWRTYGGDIGARWWFGGKAHSKPLTGHHLGIYCGVLTFDIETGGNGYMGGKPGGTLWDRCLINTGIEYGYSLPVAKRLNIDFSIGLGYLGGNYIKYFPFDNDYYRDKEYKVRFFGPTKAEISLVWLIGHGNTNNRKGGDR